MPKLEQSDPASELPPSVMTGCMRGDRAALTRFVECYQRRVFSYLSRVLGSAFPIEDLAQEVFERAYRNLKTFDANGPAKLSTWILTIAHRVGVDARRRRRAAYDAFQPERYESPLANPEQLAGQVELRAAIARAVAALPPDQREIFVLVEFHDLSTGEIAGMVGALESTVKTRLFRARARLRLALGPNHPVTP